MTSADASDLAVIIATRGRPGILRRTLAGLEAQTVQGFETIVVVDGTDRPTPLDDAAHPRVRVEIQAQAGPASARNHGVQCTTRPLVLFLDDDTIPVPVLIAEHLARHRAEPAAEVVVVGRTTWHADVAGDSLNKWLATLGIAPDDPPDEGDPRSFHRFRASNVSLKRSFFVVAGGFDPELPFDHEDLDLGWRLAQRGMLLRVAPAALAEHLQPYGWPKLTTRLEGAARGEHRMQAKHPWFEPELLPRMREPNTPDERRVAPAVLAAWEGERDLAELRAYLGDDYDHDALVHHTEIVDAEEHSAADEATFYRTSRGYLYDLTAFAMSGTKAPYLAELRRLVAPGGRILDYGCGIGADGLRLLDAGYKVDFADFDNPSTRYLRWRLAHRGLSATVYDVERDEIPGDYDAVYCFDVIEHIDDPFAFLATLEARARIVVVNFLEDVPDDTHLHKPLPIAELLDHAADRGLLHYAVHHERVHLVAYRTTPSGPAHRVRSVLERRFGPRLHRARTGNR
jgi:SAM-dependent methyltransferase